MKFGAKALIIAGCLVGLAGCGKNEEFPPQTMEAYSADDAMRADVLAACAKHVADKVPFRSQSDTAECEKARQVEQMKRFHSGKVKRGPSKAY